MSDQNGDVANHSSPKVSKEEAKKSKKNEKIQKRQEKERKEQVIDALLDMDLDEIKCGLGFFAPRWFQVFARAEVYLVVYCIAGLVLGMFFTYSVSTISTYEKRFKLTSKQSGLMLTGNDISQILLAIVVSYYGNHGHRPRWVAMGCFLTSIACILAALPHFIYGPGEDAIDTALMNVESLSNTTTSNATSTKKMNDFCQDPYEENCDASAISAKTGYIGPVVIHFMSQFLIGFVVSLVYTIGFAYMDDNVDKKQSPMYYSLSYAIRVVGPVLGYFLGSKCLAMYIIPQYNPNISKRDPRWLGAWWIGYLVLSALLAISGCLLVFFPRTLPATIYSRLKALHAKKDNAGKEFSAFSDLHTLYDISQEREESKRPSLKKLPTAIMRLLKNKIFLGNNFNYVFSLLGFMSYWTFKPKFMEFQFRKSASEATLYAGIASLIASIFGFLISGIAIKVFKPAPRPLALYSLFISILNPIMMVCLMLIGCPNLDIQGPMSWSPGLGSCDSICECSDRYSPVCSTEGEITYYSSCYAGCTGVDTGAYPVEYYNCACAPSTTTDIFQENSASNASGLYNAFYPTSLGGNVTQGYCPEKCNAFYYYLIIIIVGNMITATCKIGGSLLFLRSLEERDKGLALGITTVVISLFAFIPAPIIMGAIVDSACIIWDNTCGISGNCWLYDSDKFRIIIHAVPAVLFFISSFGDLVVYLNSEGVSLYEDKEEEDIIKSNYTDQESLNDKEMTPLTSTSI